MMKKAVLNMVWISMTGLVAMMAFGINGNAYIDPSVTTYLIQAVVGIVVAVGAAIGIYIRKAKRKINEKLNIDENRNKEVESDEVVVYAEKKEGFYEK